MSLFSSGPSAPPETCMSLRISCITGPESQSFEEVRIADYLSSYRATGRPPQPCPPYPTDPSARAAQRLPPLFVPAPFPGSAASTSAPGTFGAQPQIFGAGGGVGASTSSAAPITDPALLPLPQTFAQPVAVPQAPGASALDREAFASIAAAPEYSHWSPEELRYHAYLRGMRAPPPGTPLFEFVLPPAASSSSAPTFPGPLSVPAGQDGEQYQSITCRPEFAGHSVEELRLSFLRTGAELTSAQILAGVTSPPPSNPTSLTPGLSLPQPAANPLNPSNPFAPAPAQSQPQGGLFSTSASAPSIFGAPRPPVQPLAMGLGQQAQAQAPGGGFTFGATPAQPAPATWGTQPAAQAPAAAAPSAFSFTPLQPQQPQQQSGFSFGGPVQSPQQQGGAAAAGGAPGGGFSFGASPAAGGTGAGGTGFSFGARRGF
ncbi:hypothetical protein B0H19DRAFT_1088526 [Mycena capillaripes]|nr:hypothetical protein B0H19DRAFT_1088526 [Mycena capillaripes]